MTPEHLIQCKGCQNFAREISPRMLCVQCEFDFNVKTFDTVTRLHRVITYLNDRTEPPEEVKADIVAILRDFNDANPLNVHGH